MNTIFNLTIIVSIVLKFISCTPKGIVFDERVCDLVPEFNEQLKQQIRNISSDAQKIIDFVVNGNDTGVTYRELSYFVDRFGSRLSGTRNLEDAIDYMVELLNTEGHKVHTEDVIVPQWVRFELDAFLIIIMIQLQDKRQRMGSNDISPKKTNEYLRPGI